MVPVPVFTFLSNVHPGLVVIMLFPFVEILAIMKSPSVVPVGLFTVILVPARVPDPEGVLLTIWLVENLANRENINKIKNLESIDLESPKAVFFLQNRKGKYVLYDDLNCINLLLVYRVTINS